MKYKTGEEVLNKLYREMHISSEVMHKASPSDTPEEKIRKYISRLEHVHELSKKSKHSLELLKKFYYDKYLIKELPESYINLQKKIAREEGHGDIFVSDEMKEKMLNQVRKDQKSTIDLWIDYFMSEDAMYPTWFKVYAFKGMLGLSTFNKEKQEFGKRTDKTTSSFIDLNMEALSKVYDILKSEIGENNLTDKELEILSKGESFKKLYTYYLTNQDSKIINNDETEGIWIKYNMGSDYMPLWESLQGKNTGWCTAGKETAKTQLAGGDFYVYYTKDENGEYKNPRIAIRMNGKNEIGEVRGTSKNQNLESNMEPILDKKLEEFPNKDKYKKKVHDMKLLTVIEEKQKNNLELSLDDLKFLYEVDSKIEGFGYQDDPRIKEIISKRDKRKDIAFVYGINENEVALSQTEWEANKKRIKVYCGDLDLNCLTSAEGLKLPNTINGDLNLSCLTSTEGLKLPDMINGSLDLRSLISAEGLKLPAAINGDLDLSCLTSAEGLKLPDTIDGDLDLSCLTSAEGLKLPDMINGSLDLRSLISTEGLKLPNTINGDLYLRSLISAEGLKLPNTINGDLYLNCLTSAEGLKLPDMINGSLDLRSLISAEGLKLPNTINGDLYLSRLTSAEGLKLPNTINGDLYLRSLISTEGLKLPNTINGDLHLSRLTSAEGLKLPDTINGHLDLRSLISAKGLKLPDMINGSLDLESLTSAEGLKLPAAINGYLDLSSLTSVKDLVLPISLFGRVYSNIDIPETCFIPDEEYYKYINEDKNNENNESIRKIKIKID